MGLQPTGLTHGDFAIMAASIGRKSVRKRVRRWRHRQSGSSTESMGGDPRRERAPPLRSERQRGGLLRAPMGDPRSSVARHCHCRPRPRGGPMPASSSRSRSAIACSASPVAPCAQRFGRRLEPRSIFGLAGCGKTRNTEGDFRVRSANTRHDCRDCGIGTALERVLAACSALGRNAGMAMPPRPIAWADVPGCRRWR